MKQDKVEKGKIGEIKKKEKRVERKVKSRL